MLREEIFSMIEANPIIPAVKDDAGLMKCCRMKESSLVIILYGSICNIGGIVRKAKENGKRCIVDLDLINGLGAKPISADYLKNMTEADGVLSTKPLIVSRASELGFWTALRVFMLDSMAYSNVKKQVTIAHPDVIEIVPGTMPKIISKLSGTTDIPIMASGLISDKEDVMLALQAGAIAVAATSPSVWYL